MLNMQKLNMQNKAMQAGIKDRRAPVNL